MVKKCFPLVIYSQALSSSKTQHNVSKRGWFAACTNCVRLGAVHARAWSAAWNGLRASQCMMVGCLYAESSRLHADTVGVVWHIPRGLDNLLFDGCWLSAELVELLDQFCSLAASHL
eukprot:1995626-Pleurochrysis_carterae.AAC.3